MKKDGSGVGDRGAKKIPGWVGWIGAGVKGTRS